MSDPVLPLVGGDAQPRKQTTNIKIESTFDARRSTRVPFDVLNHERRQRLELLCDLPLQFNAASDLKALFQLIIEKVVALTAGARRSSAG